MSKEYLAHRADDKDGQHHRQECQAVFIAQLERAGRRRQRRQLDEYRIPDGNAKGRGDVKR